MKHYQGSSGKYQHKFMALPSLISPDRSTTLILYSNLLMHLVTVSHNTGDK